MEKTIIKGWLAALFSVLILWGINNVMFGYASKILQVNFIVYTCCTFLSASFILLLVGGLKDDLARETLKNPDTLIFGFLMMVVIVLGLYLFQFVTSTEGTLLQRLSMPMAIMLSYFFMDRKPDLIKILASLLVIIGSLIILGKVDYNVIGIVIFVLFLRVLAQASRVLVSENHKTYNKAVKKEVLDKKLKIRVIGFVMFLVSIMSLVISLLFAILQAYHPILDPSLILPSLDSFIDWKSIIFGLLVGILFIGPITLLEFYSANTIKAENFLAVGAFSGVATLFWEWLLAPITGLSIKSLDLNILLAGGLITLGCLISALGQIYKTKKHGAEKWRDYIKKYDEDDMHVYHSKDIVQKTLNHYDNNLEYTITALNITKCTINKIINEKNYAFKDDVSATIMANFKENVANIDYLTKIANRSGFTAIGEDFIKQGKIFSLMFIDLDKFKPINDTYGHEAGDEVLKQIANRLENLVTDDIKIARLAGDEFVILFNNYEKSHLINHLQGFEDIIQADITIATNITVNVKASIGLAQYSTDANTLDGLLEYADKRMYSHKNKK